MDFNNVICKDLNIYAFGEGLPIDNYWQDFHGLKNSLYTYIPWLELFYVVESWFIL